MPVPYRKTPKSAASPEAAYLDVVYLRSSGVFYGAILVIDSRGQPLEFVHNTLAAPTGFLWPEEQVLSLGIASLCHSLFDACQREPELLVCRASLGSAAYCNAEIAPSIPFAQIMESSNEEPAAWIWINDPPSPGMAAHSLSEMLQNRGFALEPFARIHQGLREVYPQAPWSDVDDDSRG